MKSYEVVVEMMGGQVLYGCETKDEAEQKATAFMRDGFGGRYPTECRVRPVRIKCDGCGAWFDAIEEEAHGFKGHMCVKCGRRQREMVDTLRLYGQLRGWRS